MSQDIASWQMFGFWLFFNVYLQCTLIFTATLRVSWGVWEFALRGRENRDSDRPGDLEPPDPGYRPSLGSGLFLNQRTSHERKFVR